MRKFCSGKHNEIIPIIQMVIEENFEQLVVPSVDSQELGQKKKRKQKSSMGHSIRKKMSHERNQHSQPESISDRMAELFSSFKISQQQHKKLKRTITKEQNSIMEKYRPFSTKADSTSSSQNRYDVQSRSSEQGGNETSKKQCTINTKSRFANIKSRFTMNTDSSDSSKSVGKKEEKKQSNTRLAAIAQNRKLKEHLKMMKIKSKKNIEKKKLEAFKHSTSAFQNSSKHIPAGNSRLFGRKSMKSADLRSPCAKNIASLNYLSSKIPSLKMKSGYHASRQNRKQIKSLSPKISQKMLTTVLSESALLKKKKLKLDPSSRSTKKKAGTRS